jgi:hypothetical protein
MLPRALSPIAPLILPALAALAVACNGGGSDATVEPGAEVSPTAGVVTSPAAGEAPAAPAPEVDPSLEVLDTGELNLHIGAGQKYGFEPLELAGLEPPPCAAFVFLLGWQVQDPYPPEGVALTIASTRMGSSETIDEETSGTASLGCGYVEVSNRSAFTISVQVRYAIARVTG